MSYRIFSKIIPKNVAGKYVNLLNYTEISIEPYRFVGFVLSFGFGLAWFVAFLVAYFSKFSLWISFIAVFVSIEVGIYMWIMLSIDAKAKFVETVLPDALQLMASNLRAGLTVDKALLLAARPEFGYFKDELNRIGKEVTIGKSMEESLTDMTKRIRSDKLEKTVDLIVTGLRSGGELASLLEQTSRSLREREFVDQKIRSSIKMYTVFIFAAIGFGAPLLYGLSTFLIEVLTNLLSQIEIPENVGMSVPLRLSTIAVSTNFMLTYIIISLITTAVLGSLVLGLISKGEEKYGFKTAPFLVALTLAMFFLVRFLISSLLGGLFNF